MTLLTFEITAGSEWSRGNLPYIAGNILTYLSYIKCLHEFILWSPLLFFKTHYVFKFFLASRFLRISFIFFWFLFFFLMLHLHIIIKVEGKMESHWREETVALQQLLCIRHTKTKTARLWCTVSSLPLSTNSLVLPSPHHTPLLLFFLSFSFSTTSACLSFQTWYSSSLFFVTLSPYLLFKVLSCFCLELLSFFSVPPPLVLFPLLFLSLL